MAKGRRSSSPEPPQEPLTLRVTLAHAEAQLRDRMVKGAAIQAARIEDRRSLDQVRNRFYTWDEYNRDLLKSLFTSPELADEYSRTYGAVFAGQERLDDEVKEFRNDVADKLRHLDSVIERLSLYQPEAAKATSGSLPRSTSRAVFLVHGRDDGLKETVARFLGQLDLKPVILHEQANRGETVIEKFEAHSDAHFAVVLLTPDDEGRLAGDPSAGLRPRARQNVVFEWGFFVGKLGRGKVCALYSLDSAEFVLSLHHPALRAALTSVESL